MKKWMVLCLALALILSLVGCGKEMTIQFHDKTFAQSDLSRDTVAWLVWYHGLTEAEQLSVSAIPADLYALCGYPEDAEAMGAENP